MSSPHPYWADPNYTATVCAQVPGCVRTLMSPSLYPVMLLQPEERPMHLACPPGFLSPQESESAIGFIDFVTQAAQKYEACTGFLQFRGGDIAPLEQHLKGKFLHFLIEKRDTVHIELSDHEQAMLSACRRDTRSRLRQVFKQGLSHRLEVHPRFCEFYSVIAEANQFSSPYRYDDSSIQALQQAQGTYPVSVFDQDQTYLGGALLGRVNESLCDYILSAYDTGNPNAGRAVLWESLRAARTLGFTEINLGGGVKDNDGLFDFKMSFNGKSVPFYTIKIIFNADTYRKAYNISGSSFDLTGRFPPP